MPSFDARTAASLRAARRLNCTDAVPPACALATMQLAMLQQSLPSPHLRKVALHEVQEALVVARVHPRVCATTWEDVQYVVLRALRGVLAQVLAAGQHTQSRGGSKNDTSWQQSVRKATARLTSYHQRRRLLQAGGQRGAEPLHLWRVLVRGAEEHRQVKHWQLGAQRVGIHARLQSSGQQQQQAGRGNQLGRRRGGADADARGSPCDSGMCVLHPPGVHLVENHCSSLMYGCSHPPIAPAAARARAPPLLLPRCRRWWR